MKKWAVGVAVLISLVVATPSSGGCRAIVKRAVVVNKVVEKVAVVEKVNIVPTFLAAFVPVPVLNYGANVVPGAPAGYQAPVQGTPYQAPIQQGNDQLLTILQRLEQRLVNLETRAGIAQPQQASPAPMPRADNGAPPPPSPGVVAFLTKSCAACHESATANRDGGGLILLQGTNVVPLSPELRLKMIAKVQEGKMPPPDNIKGIKPPTDEEFDGFLRSLVK